MGFFNGDPTTTQTSTTDQWTRYTPDPGSMSQWQNTLGTAGGLRDWMINNNPPQASVADPSGLTNQYWNQTAARTGAPDANVVSGEMRDISTGIGGTFRDPNAFGLPSNFNFQPGGLNFNDPFQAGVPQMSGPGRVGGTA